MAKRHVLLMALFVLMAGLVSAQSADPLAWSDGHYWQTLTPREKLLLVRGIVEGIGVAAIAEVAARVVQDPEERNQILARTYIKRTPEEIVSSIDERFQADQANLTDSIAGVIVVDECAGSEEIRRGSLALPDD